MKQDLDMNRFVSSLTTAARDNPLAAALIGGGALWLLLGNRPINRLASGIATATQTVADQGIRQAARAGEAVADAGARVADAASEAGSQGANAAARYASSIKDRIGDAATSVSDSISKQSRGIASSAPSPYQSVRDAAPRLRKGYSNAQAALSDLLERQPLALGVIGLALGACIASAAPATDTEKEWIGPLGDEVSDEIKRRAAAVAEAGRRATGEIANEFRSAAGDAADIVSKAGTEATHTTQSTAERSVRRPESVR